jgi:hypothetical protein
MKSFLNNPIRTVSIGCFVFVVALVLLRQAGAGSQFVGDLKCVDCRAEYSNSGAITFRIVNGSQQAVYVNFGLKVNTGNGWKLLVDDVRQASRNNKIGSYKIAPHGTVVVNWDRQVGLPANQITGDGGAGADSEVVPYDITKRR